jgi:hypothetical protein
VIVECQKTGEPNMRKCVFPFHSSFGYLYYCNANFMYDVFLNITQKGIKINVNKLCLNPNFMAMNTANWVRTLHYEKTRTARKPA